MDNEHLKDSEHHGRTHTHIFDIKNIQFVCDRKPDLLVRCQVVYDVCVSCDAGRKQRRHAVAVLLHGGSILQQHAHDLQTARLCTVMQRRVACEHSTCLTSILGIVTTTYI